MKRRCMYLLALLLLLSVCLPGCQNAVPSVTDTGTSKSVDVGAAALTIHVWEYETNALNATAKRFEEKTGIQVIIENAFDLLAPDYGLEAYIMQTNTQLMGGQGADIYSFQNGHGGDLYGGNEVHSFGEKGMLVDFAELYRKGDPVFNDEVLFWKGLAGNDETKSLYFVRDAISPDSVLVLSTIPEFDKAVDYDPFDKEMSWKEFFQEHATLRERLNYEGIALSKTDIDLFQLQFIQRFEEFVDIEGKTHNLDSSAMIDLLEQTKQWAEDGLIVALPNSENYAWESTAHMYHNFPMFSVGLLQTLAVPDLDSGEIPSSMMGWRLSIPTPGQKANKEYIWETSGGLEMSVNANSANKENALEFLRYWLSEEEQTASGNDEFIFYINRAAFKKQIDKTFEVMAEDGYEVKTEQKEKLAQRALEWVETREYCRLPNSKITGFVYEKAREFFMGNISAEQAAKNMAQTVTLYLKELA
ncbi:ABC transporter substrate-binding protein [Clostridia bacterium OttesenSCG-928-F22]|nr:ABC transporter substrate-binding protein [Clostridia bacterium OttesenSCG-928-F22]